MAPITKFAVAEKYTYLEGWGNYHSSEAVKGSISRVINSPQKPAFGLETERFSGTSFVAPRSTNLQTWMYRVNRSIKHTPFRPIGNNQEPTQTASPNSYSLPAYEPKPGSDWTSQRLIAKNGDPLTKSGLAVWLFGIDKSMPANTVFSSMDGDCLIVPQAGALDIQTELGHLLVRQNEICVIPRAIRYRVTLPDGASHARGYIIEVYQGNFVLPELGIVGSIGLANSRDFQVPVASFDGTLAPGSDQAVVEKAGWTYTTRHGGRLWACTQDHTPFDVAGWHGTYYPYKYDLARFSVLGNLVYDEHDPCLHIVLTAPNVADFAIFGPRWSVAEDTLWPPYFHSNIMGELLGTIVHSQDPNFGPNKTKAFSPTVTSIDGPMTTHGPTDQEFEDARKQDLAPQKIMNEGISGFLLETVRPLHMATWAVEAATANYGALE